MSEAVIPKTLPVSRTPLVTMKSRRFRCLPDGRVLDVVSAVEIGRRRSRNSIVGKSTRFRRYRPYVVLVRT